MALGRTAALALVAVAALGPACPARADAPVENEAPVEKPAGAAADHQSGLGVRLSRVAFFPDSTLVMARVENRAPRELALNAAGRFVLRDDKGGIYRLAAPAANREVALAPGAALDGAFVFVGGIDPSAKALFLEVGQALGAVDARPLVLPLPRPPSPETGEKAAEMGRAAHPNGTILGVTALSLGEDSVLVDLVATNGGRGDVRLNGGRGLVLIEEGEGGAVHSLLPPRSNPELVVPPGRRLDGRLVFAGCVSPGAARLRLVTNDQGGGSPDGAATPQPVLSLSLDLDRAARAALPPALAQATHPNGLQITVTGIAAAADGIAVAARIVNGHARPVRLNNAGGLRLADAGGGLHALRPPADGPEAEIAAGERADARLFFPGAGAGPWRLLTNQGLAGSATSAFTALPVLSVEIPVPDAGAMPPADAVAGASRIDGRPLPPSRAEDGPTRAAEAALKPGGEDATLTGAPPPVSPAGSSPR